MWNSSYIIPMLNGHPVSTNIQGNNLEIDKDVTKALTSKSMSVTTGSKVTDKTESKCTIHKQDFPYLETHRQAHQYHCDVCDLEFSHKIHKIIQIIHQAKCGIC